MLHELAKHPLDPSVLAAALRSGRSLSRHVALGVAAWSGQPLVTALLERHWLRRYEDRNAVLDALGSARNVTAANLLIQICRASRPGSEVRSDVVLALGRTQTRVAARYLAQQVIPTLDGDLALVAWIRCTSCELTWRSEPPCSERRVALLESLSSYQGASSQDVRSSIRSIRRSETLYRSR